MDATTYEILRLMVINRAIISYPRSHEALLHERQQAQQLSTFIPHRLVELNITTRDLAQKIDIESEFITSLLEGTFPLSVLSRDMWRALADALQMSVANLRQVTSALGR